MCVCVWVSGDGANDVSMIQVADVGVGISGQEGMQVHLFSFLRFFFSALLHSSYKCAKVSDVSTDLIVKANAVVPLNLWAHLLFCGWIMHNVNALTVLKQFADNK